MTENSANKAQVTDFELECYHSPSLQFLHDEDQIQGQAEMNKWNHYLPDAKSPCRIAVYEQGHGSLEGCMLDVRPGLSNWVQ